LRAALPLAAVLLLAACHRDPAALRLREGAPVVLVSIDTLRSDHLPAYGYRGVETPAIDALRREAILFRHAYTVTPLTLPAHASLLTGVLPEVHGVRDNVGYGLDPARRKAGTKAGGDLPLLAPLLRERGYATAAAVSAYVLQGRSGIAEGFDLYEDGIELVAGRGLGQLQRPGAETLARLLPWLSEHAAGPFFVWLHLYEPHTPYRPPPAFAKRGRTPYDGEIAAADAVVGDLFAELHRLGRWDDSLVILLADHGEGLGDHGEDEHGVLLYREAIQVPLLLKLPKAERGGDTAEAPVSLVDVAPTIGDLLGIERPAAWRRPSLLAALGGVGAPPSYAETFYPRLHFGWSDLAAAVDGRFHLVMGPHPELYDLGADPGERRNLLPGERRAFAALRDEVGRHDRRFAAPGEVDPEARAAMAALGYVGSAGAGALEGPLPDPRPHLGELRDLKAGFEALARHDTAGAVAAYRRVLAENPGMVDAWEFLGRALERLERPDEALAAYQEAMRRSAGSPHIAMAAASLLLAQGRVAEAEEHARLALAAHPSFAHGLLAQAALSRQDLGAAEREARLAAGADTGADRIGPALVLATVEHAQGRFEEALVTSAGALAAWRARSERDPDLLRGAYLLRGRIYADLGRAAEAETALRREMELFPDDPQAYTNLALLLALTGRNGEVGPVLRRLIEEHPSPLAYVEAAKALRVLAFPAQADRLLAEGRRAYPGNPLLRPG
jgi:arylsulfatase A-like enzyme/Flp pilus assembly protein TadD